MFLNTCLNINYVKKYIINYTLVIINGESLKLILLFILAYYFYKKKKKLIFCEQKVYNVYAQDNAWNPTACTSFHV